MVKTVNIGRQKKSRGTWQLPQFRRCQIFIFWYSKWYSNITCEKKHVLL